MAAAPEPDVSALISVAEAIRIIDSVPVVPRAARVPLAQAAGLRLAAEIVADRDYPPFPKSLMDGFAVRAADVRAAPAVLRLVGEIPAGREPARGIGAGETMAIMTGAPLPQGADGVVPVEDTVREEIGEGAAPLIKVVRSGAPIRYVAARGSDCPARQVVLPAGTVMGPAQLAVAASVGAAEVSMYEAPRVAVLGTGSELVPIDQDPSRVQIRNSNSLMIASLMARMGCHVTDLGTAVDEPDAIRAKIEEGLGYDALFVTGGMSMGAYDHVPRLLKELGVELRITKLKIKPGKPFVFGVGKQRSEVGGQSSVAAAEPNSELRPLSPPLVFGLPGNPVSAFICAVRLASRIVDRLAGGAVRENWVVGKVASGMVPNGPREFYQPCIRAIPPGRVSAQTSLPTIKVLTWKGSADLFTLARANALLVRGENEPAVPEGTMVRVLEIG